MRSFISWVFFLTSFRFSVVFDSSFFALSHLFPASIPRREKHRWKSSYVLVNYKYSTIRTVKDLVSLALTLCKSWAALAPFFSRVRFVFRFLFVDDARGMSSFIYYSLLSLALLYVHENIAECSKKDKKKKNSEKKRVHISGSVAKYRSLSFFETKSCFHWSSRFVHLFSYSVSSFWITVPNELQYSRGSSTSSFSNTQTDAYNRKQLHEWMVTEYESVLHNNGAKKEREALRWKRDNWTNQV